MDVPQLIRNALRIREITQARLARSVGVSQGTISKWLSEKQYPNKKQWDRVIRFLQADPRTSQLVQEVQRVQDDGAGRTITSFGYLGAGSVIASGDRTGKSRAIPLPRGAPSGMGVVVVRGDWNYPTYRDGDRIFFVRQDQSISEAVGHECVVRVANGRTFLKTLRRGSGRNLFNLEGINAPPMEDQRIEWAALVRWIERA